VGLMIDPRDPAQPIW